MKRAHIRAVSSLFGTVDFLTLTVPDEAEVMATAYGSDITQYERRGHLAYVTYGESYHVLATPSYTVDMRIVVRPGRKDLRPRIRIEKTGETEMGGHPAAYYVGRGIITGRSKNHLFTVHYCDVTDRTIQIMFKGPSDLDVMKILEDVGVLCHEMGGV
ncbi:MAG: hypothetical protein QI197_00165 [Candidatus Korarchaeota archaeon]|nr:hypothetical protein [Candidatus Korarchaeota archaeon]